MEKEVIYTNVDISPEKAYVFFVGDVKYIDTTTHLSEFLRRRYGRPVEVINILSNMPPPYMEENFVVINPKLEDYISSREDNRYFMPVDQPQINKDVSRSSHVRGIADQILENQDELFINLFKSTPEMTLPQKDERIKVIGPDPELFSYFDNKINQRRIAKELCIPVPKGYIADSFEELLSLYSSHFGHEAYVACANGFGGNGSETVSNLEDITSSEKLRGKIGFIISEHLDLDLSVTTQGIAANQEEVAFVGLSDMLMDGVNYKGVIYPSKASSDHIEKMMDYTFKIGRYMGRGGYKGSFNIDFMIDKDGNLYLTEINPRKGGSTPEIIMAHSSNNPFLISVPELEFIAVTEGTFGDIDISQYILPDMNWGVLGVKLKKGQRTLNYAPRHRKEKDIFRESGTTILDHPGENITYTDDGRLARIVAVEKDINDCDPRSIILRKLAEEESKIKAA